MKKHSEIRTLFRFNGPAGSFVEDRVRVCHLFVPGHRDPGVFPFHPKGGDADAPFCGTWDLEPLRHADLVRGAHVVVEMDRRPGKAGEAGRIPPKSTTESRQGPQRN